MGGSISSAARRDIDSALAASELAPKSRKLHFVCVRVGAAYGPEYVERLVDMFARNATRLEGDGQFWCLTDAPEDLPEGVAAIPYNPDLPGWWQKVYLFSDAMPWGMGDRVIYMDLDVAITGRLEDLVETPGIIRDWLWPCYNSSVMVWDHGEHAAIWSAFRPEIMTQPGRVVPPECLPAGQVNGGDQEWITEISERTEHWRLFPDSWTRTFRDCRDWPPTGCKVVSFNGKPKPHEVTDGWVPDVWKVGGFTSLPVMDGANVSVEGILENVRANVVRDLPWFGGFMGEAHRATRVVLACGGPSMLADIPNIRAHKRRGARIVTVNNAWRTLVAAGIKPDVHIMLDARPENAEFVADAPEGVRYLIASQCHPDVFDTLERLGREVVVWHNGFGNSEELREILAPWWGEGPNQRPCVLVPGGGTVGLRALWLCAFSGYLFLHVYGMDSSYSGDVHHAYPQAINDDDDTQTVVMGGKSYRCARWMVRQAEEFKTAWNDLGREGISLFVHGRGLVPDIAAKLRAEGMA